jgi:hypothetical protein
MNMSAKQKFGAIVFVLVLAAAVFLVYYPEENNIAAPPAYPKNDSPSKNDAVVASSTDAHWESDFSFPYPVSWTDWNRATVSLARVSLDQTENFYRLRLYFGVKTSDGGFCSTTFQTTLKRVVGEEGDTVVPAATSKECVEASGALKNQLVEFDRIPASEKEILIQFVPALRDPKSSQTFFIITPLSDHKVKVEPASTEG